MHRRIDSLEGKVAVIIGARGGIGYATAMRLASKGARIVGVVRRKINETETMFEKLPHQELGHIVVKASVDDSNALNATAQFVEEGIKRCDILVNTAGITRKVDHENLNGLTDDLFDEIMKINVRGTFAAIRAFTPLLKKSNDGLIVNISSAAGIKTGGSNIAYAASKAAMDSMTRNLSKVLAPDVRIVNIAPSAIDTEFLTTRSPKFFENTIRNTPLKRMGEVDDVASAIEALATTMRFVTGNTFSIDGGRTI